MRCNLTLVKRLVSLGLSCALLELKSGRYRLTKVDEKFTKFESALLTITTPSPGRVEDFIDLLQERLDGQLETPPMNQTIDKPF